MTTPAFSIIIPAFNCAHYLDACLRSIIKSVLDNDEVIIVDDGSQDGTGAICDAFALENPRVMSFHTNHLGVAAARNFGIEKATRDYLIFVDSDDAWASSFHLNDLRLFISEQNCDLWVFGYYIRNRQKDNPIPAPFWVTYDWRKDQNTFLSLFQNGMMFPCWNKVFKRAILSVFSIRFKSQQMEDFQFVLDYLTQIHAVSFLPIMPYIYIKREEGTSLTEGLQPSILDGNTACHQQLLFLFNSEFDLTIHRIMAPQYIGAVNKCLRNKDKSLAGTVLNCIQKNRWAQLSLCSYRPVSLSDHLSIYLIRHGYFVALSRYRKTVTAIKWLLGK